MALPARKPSLTKAQRSAGEYSIATPVTEPTLSQPSSPAANTLSVVPTQQPTVQPTPSPVVRTAPLQDIDFTRDVLLATPKEITNVVLDRPLTAGLRRIRADLRFQGLRVSMGTLVAEALAYAYEHHTRWQENITADGRRRRTVTTDPQEPTPRRRTSFMLPSGLAAAAELMVWRIGEDDTAVIPSIIGLQTTALTWGLDQQQAWLPGRIAQWTK